MQIFVKTRSHCLRAIEVTEIQHLFPPPSLLKFMLKGRYSLGERAMVTNSKTCCTVCFHALFATSSVQIEKSAWHISFLLPPLFKILPCAIFLIIIFNVTQKTALHLSCLLVWLITYFYFAFFLSFYAACEANFNQCFSTRRNTIHRTLFMPQDQRQKLRFITPKDSRFLTKHIKRRMFN